MSDTQDNSKPAPRYCFIVVSFNTLALTRAALASIRQHAAGSPHEVIVVDNGSSDGSGPTLAREFPEVRFVDSGQNRGYPFGANRGADLATAPWLVLLNSDAELLPDTLPKTEALLSRHPEIDILGGQLLNSDGSLQRSVMFERPCRHFEQQHQQAELLRVDGLVGAYLVVRTELWVRLGGMDEQFFLYYEEADLCWRARKSGAGLFWSPGVRTVHHRGSSTGQVSLRSKVEMWRSRYHFNRRHLSRGRYCLSCVGGVASLAFNTVGNLLLCGLTAGCYQKSRHRLRWYWHLLKWHLHGRPDEWGLAKRPAV